jgi:hypothetical protein
VQFAATVAAVVPATSLRYSHLLIPKILREATGFNAPGKPTLARRPGRIGVLY